MQNSDIINNFTRRIEELTLGKFGKCVLFLQNNAPTPKLQISMSFIKALIRQTWLPRTVVFPQTEQVCNKKSYFSGHHEIVFLKGLQRLL